MKKKVVVGVFAGAMMLALSGCKGTEIFEPGNEVVADSGFDITKDAFPFSNYSIYREGKLAQGQCFGISMVSQLYYRGILPYKQDEVEERELDGIIGGDKISGASYNLAFVLGDEITEEGYLNNEVPLSERFRSVGYELARDRNGKWERSEENPNNLVISEERKEQIANNPLYFTKTEKASAGAKWNDGDGKIVEEYESIYLTLDNVNPIVQTFKSEEHRKQYQLLCMINHWHATQGMDVYKEIDVITSISQGNNPQKKNFDELVKKINEGIPVVMSCEEHTINAIRIEKNKDNPTQYLLIVCDSNYPGTEKVVMIKVKEKEEGSLNEYDALYLNNEYVYEFYDYHGLFGPVGEMIKPKFYYMPSETSIVKPVPTQKTTVTSKPTITPMTTAVPQPIVPQIPMPTTAPKATATPIPEVTGIPQPVITPTPTPEVTPKLSADVKVGDEVTFGVYEQDTDLENGSEKIIWKVIGVEDGKALLLSKYCLDNVTYNDVRTVISWKDSKIRNYLNQEFYETVFSKDEKACIVTSTVTNERDERFESTTEDGETTMDNVFLLSKKEVEQYLTFEERQAEATLYAKARGLSVGWGTLSCDWYIRTTGGVKWNVGKYLSEGGWSQTCGSKENGLRPAVWVDLANVK